MPRINLLPWREVERKRKRQEFIVAAVAAVGLALLTGFVLRWQYGSIIDSQNARNQYLNEQIQQIDKQIEEINGLEAQKQSLQSRIQVIEQLTEVKQTDRRIQIKGIAESSTRVSAFMRNIDGSQWLKDPSLEIVETMGTGETGASFTLYANQTAVAEPAATNAATGKKSPAGTATNKEAA